MYRSVNYSMKVTVPYFIIFFAEPFAKS